MVLEYCSRHAIDVVLSQHKLGNYISLNPCCVGEVSVLDGYITSPLGCVYRVARTLLLGPVVEGENIHPHSIILGTISESRYGNETIG